MSFFDDDEPIRASRTRPARPRTPAPAGSRAVGGGGGGRPPRGSGGARRPDPATARQRQLVLGGGAIVLFILLILLVSSCQGSRKERALKDYNRSVTELATDSDKVGVDFFAALDAASAGTDVEVRVNQLRLTADELVKRANGLEPRDELARAQSSLELVLNLRAQGLRKIGEKLPTALVQGRDNAQSVETALTQIAGQMQQFLASDVVYSQRTAPYIREALSDADVKGQRVSISRFLPSLGWLDPDLVAGRLGSQRAGGGTGAGREPAPGLHGHSLESVAVGDTTLQPGGVVNTIPTRPAPSFTIKLANGGDFDEDEVVVTARISGGGTRAISRKKTIAQTKSKGDATVTIPLGASPASGAATLTVTIGKVPGEEGTENNKQTYTILFRQ
jgi:hypothetical protein